MKTVVLTKILIFLTFLTSLIYTTIPICFLITEPFFAEEPTKTEDIYKTSALSFNQHESYERFLESGDIISYHINSQYDEDISYPILYGIGNQSFNELPIKKFNYTYLAGALLQNNLAQTNKFVLTSKSVIKFNFEANGPISLSIANKLPYESPTEIYFKLTERDHGHGYLEINKTQAYYFIWTNDSNYPTFVDYTINITYFVRDFSNLNIFMIKDRTYKEIAFIVPYTGNWYFHAYFEPSLAYSPYRTDTHSRIKTLNLSFITELKTSDVFTLFNLISLISLGIEISLFIVVIRLNKHSRTEQN